MGLHQDVQGSMAENVIYVKGSRRDVRRAIMQAVKAASGESSVAREAAEAMQVRIGIVALGRIRKAFIVKARGGTDESGLKWPPLKRSTVAYSRRHPGVPKANVRAAFRPSWMLSDKQRAKWWEIYRRCLAWTKDTARAAQIAWATVKRDGSTTLLAKYGDTQVDILRDTELLLNSLSPGIAPGEVENQVFRVGSGEVIVGTNRKHAGAHHVGIPGKLPQRRLWPEPSQWPESWWEDIAAEAKAGYIDILIHLLTNKG